MQMIHHREKQRNANKHKDVAVTQQCHAMNKLNNPLGIRSIKYPGCNCYILHPSAYISTTSTTGQGHLGKMTTAA